MHSRPAITTNTSTNTTTPTIFGTTKMGHGLARSWISSVLLCRHLLTPSQEGHVKCNVKVVEQNMSTVKSPPESTHDKAIAGGGGRVSRSPTDHARSVRLRTPTTRSFRPAAYPPCQKGRAQPLPFS